MKKITLLVIGILFSGILYSQTTAIPDANFEQALIDLDIDSDNTVNGSVLTADISGVTALSVPSKSIGDLTGIEDFTSLVSLTCSGNFLTTLNVTQNKALQVLNCYNNNLSSLDVSQNTILGTLKCFNNQLTSLNVTLNTSLIGLYCYNNNITNLDVTQNTELTVLNCSNNQLENLDVTQNTLLANLVCSDNQISELDISQCTGITNLSCSNNLITSLDVSQHLGLVNLYCSDNQLTNLEMGQHSSLVTFYAFNNQISTLDVSECLAITSLYCHSNQLSKLDVSLNPNLLYFRCYNNMLTELDVKNGNNSKIVIFDAQNNSSLDCIQIDDEAAANGSQAPYTNWLKDATSTYAEDCGYALSLNDELLEQGLSFYPNPVSNMLTIDSEIPLVKVEIYSMLGKKIKEVNSNFKSIPLENISSGVYLVNIHSKEGFTVKKIIKN